SWIHPSGHGPGNGTVSYTVDANPNYTARVGSIAAGTGTFTITQAGAPTPLGIVLDHTNLAWPPSPDCPWYGTNPPAPTYDGVNPAVSGNRFVPDSVSWLETTVTGPGVVGFWWRVSSDVTPPPPDPATSFDYLEFLIDGESQDQIMGFIDWNYRT